MSSNRPQPSLRRVLLIDAATCAAMGVLLAAGAPAVEGLTRIPAALLFYAGLSLLPIAAFMAVAALQSGIRRPAARLVILGNLLWIAASLLLLAAGWVRPNAAGTGFIILQAAAVAVLTVLEQRALRNEAAAFEAG